MKNLNEKSEVEALPCGTGQGHFLIICGTPLVKHTEKNGLVETACLADIYLFL